MDEWIDGLGDHMYFSTLGAKKDFCKMATDGNDWYKPLLGPRDVIWVETYALRASERPLPSKEQWTSY